MFNLRALIKLISFWLIVFFVQRCVFFIINMADYAGTFNDFMFCHIKALSMDLATACYLTALPLLVVLISWFVKSNKASDKIVQISTIIILAIVCFIGIADMGLYKTWGSKINTRALSYLAFPDEVLPTVFAWQNLGLVLFGNAQFFVFRWLYKKMNIKFAMADLNIVLPLKMLFSVLIIGIYIICFRGGLQRVPLNRNWIFHSQHALLNYASLNSFWNFADLISRPVKADENPYKFYDKDFIQQNFEALHQVKVDSTLQVFTTPKPNVVIIFLESWAADVIECLGGEKEVTPKFCKLTDEGILFTNFHSTGYRTEQGLMAVLSSFPAQPISSIVQKFGRFDKLPNLFRSFNDAGYHTSYYSGGRLQFDNIEAYLRASGVKKMVGEDDFEIKKRTLWGAYDEELFELHKNELNKMPQPFFSAITTLTTHEWFDADVPKIFTKDVEKVNDDYRNTMHYADSCLYEYIMYAQKQDWYKNTVFVILADHSCRIPKNRNNYERERHHIPMLLLGGALKPEYRGMKNNNIASHVDIAATVLSQLGIEHSAYKRSKNLFNKHAPKFAYYTFDNGFGMITQNNYVVYDHYQGKHILPENTDSNTLLLVKKGKAYLQHNFQEGLDFETQK